ncbi:putative quinone oxidoreductase [Tothia fuscella]|uniref:Quinone oxidoreductase n=1 Tax=Tothia fuscella TaxID=1048955 RepID=A0A9P4NPE8_9PEZI|nr:putative quinone oxidoreductase [Tothia fuscella]
MRAINIHEGRTAADLYIAENVQDPEATEDKLLVRIKAFGVNRMDIGQRQGNYPPAVMALFGKILGVEFSGVVEAKGPDASDRFKVGDEVLGLAKGEAYAEKIALTEKMIMPKPSNLSFEEAAGVPETFFTAFQASHIHGNLKPGKSVLIHAAASGVGLSAIQLAKYLGASKVFATAGSEEKIALCKQVGADVAINYKTDDWAQIVLAETEEKGVDLIIDMVGASYWERNLKVAATDGTIIFVAALSGSVVEKFDFRVLQMKRLIVTGTALRSRSLEYGYELKKTFEQVLLPGFKDGTLKVVIDEVFSWKDVGKAHAKMGRNENAGKLICVVD